MKLTKLVDIVWKCPKTSVLNRAWQRMIRDLDMILMSNDQVNSYKKTLVHIYIKDWLDKENYRLEIQEEDNNNLINIEGGDELGVIYGLLRLSELVGIRPFWFWNDQIFTREIAINIDDGLYTPPNYELEYRGWFINDEVLLDYWGQISRDRISGITENHAFEMAMESLLRLGGNLVIPGTDKNSHLYKKLATSMGLYITHHHAEPLGARMFARVYPELNPSYNEYPQLFEALWREAIEEQKDAKVIWNIGFRGQGDRPFWSDDPTYDTPEKRGTLISKLIKKQYDILCEYFEEPICCTNLYGEIMELYQEGYIQLPENVIYIWADNGYGKMVSRRQGNHNPRVVALPTGKGGRHGSYYHASFYDLQAAAHMTMLPNSTAFVSSAIKDGMDKGIRDMIIVNCSNIKPHTYMLHKISEVWGKESDTYTDLYFPDNSKDVEDLYQDYFKAMLKTGTHEDEHAGEQFYHYGIRGICHGWILCRRNESENSLKWLTKDIGLSEQILVFKKIVESGRETMNDYFSKCNAFYQRIENKSEARLFKDSLLLQATIHYESSEALYGLCMAYEDFLEKDYEQAFLRVGQSIECIERILRAYQEASHDKWKSYYDNDCLTDVKFTGYRMKDIMAYLRNLGDGPHYYHWMLKYLNKEEDRKVVLITNIVNHPTDWEIYMAMKAL